MIIKPVEKVIAVYDKPKLPLFRKKIKIEKKEPEVKTIVRLVDIFV